MQALILAAGMGKRLKDLTRDNTKCMVKVNGVTLIERMLSQLDGLDLSKIIIVKGYKGDELEQYIRSLNIRTNIEFVTNAEYSKTNNIFSLFLARHYLIQDDTLLLESDLIFESKVLNKILDESYPNLALVDKFESWMDGTVVTLDDEDNIKRFIPNSYFSFEEIPQYYKTVNIYKFSKEFSKSHYIPFLEAYCRALGNNEYYEQVLRVITLLDKPEIKALRLSNEDLWYEIDDLQDLDIAESIFASEAEKLTKIENRYGGFWRYPHMLDFCYLVNPFFPNQKLIDEIKANFERLIHSYPSGININNMLIAKYYGINKSYVCVGNGCTELIKSIMNLIDGNIGIIFPTFEEYPNRLSKDRIIPFIPTRKDYTYRINDLIDHFSDKDLSALVVINPDNPSGNFIQPIELLRLAEWATTEKIKLIIDESFVDFADGVEQHSLLDESVLRDYPNLIIVKSISKSYGVPGLRLGLVASGNLELISRIRNDVSIWNINSFAEFYLQIFEKYRSIYMESLNEYKLERERFTSELTSIPYLKVIPSQANYVMCEVVEPFTSKGLSEKLLVNYNILIKDLSNKRGINNKNFIRIAIRNRGDNSLLVEALRNLLEREAYENR